MTQEAEVRIDSRNESLAEQHHDERGNRVQTVVRELLHTFRMEERRQLSVDRCVTVCFVPHSQPLLSPPLPLSS